ncbi:DUF6140 family protein [Aequorivita sp. KMM 9714]|uniref:DUF6140 family protein n=1 Tax=Aequorivita sp. KMM 9714 TaxID=2707173 RepID=UPI0013EA0FA1|nr:DUF6140 family protein [Aequorivita sp. KMM 9714]NGX84813.1 hypothetical protein [Aequorivita sp. KMM 9714]
MAVFEIKTKERMNVNGEFVDKGLSVQISTMHSNPFEEADKINKTFMRIHGFDLKSAGYLSMGYLEYRTV